MNFSQFATFDFQISEIVSRTGRSLPQTLSCLHEAGYTHISANIATASADWIKTVREAGFGLFQLYAAADYRDPAGRKELTDRIASAAEELLPESLMLIPAEYPDLPFEIIAENMNELGRRLSASGVQMEMEDFDCGNPPRSYASSSGLLRYMDAVPSLRCCFDTGNFIRSGECYRAVYAKLKHLVTHVHLKDRLNTDLYGPEQIRSASGMPFMPAPVGSGNLKLNEFLNELWTDGFRGVLALEYGGCRDPLAAARASIDFVRSIQDRSS